MSAGDAVLKTSPTWATFSRRFRPTSKATFDIDSRLHNNLACRLLQGHGFLSQAKSNAVFCGRERGKLTKEGHIHVQT
jgi:hypothetical protein